MQYSEPVVIQTRSQSRNEINTHTERFVQKHNNFLYLKRSYLVLNEEKRKQGNKKEKLTESFQVDGENSKKVDIGFRNFA